jgi:hypothetical protein
VPLNTITASTPMRLRFGYIAASAAATFAIAGAVIVVADDSPLPGQPAVTRHADIRANKAASMRALGHELEQRRATSVSRYDDIEVNKARVQRRR